MTDNVEQAIFHVAEWLRVPVLVLALVALAVTVIELGALVVELIHRRKRSIDRIEGAAESGKKALAGDDREQARFALRSVAASESMATALDSIVDNSQQPGGDQKVAKALADFDYRSLRRLERTRMLIRAGPALGLMGTLIPLSPALAALARGDVQELSDNLRIAFSVTVLGLLVGAVAYAVSLVRDRLYGQDLSDLEYIAAEMETAP
jgi:biopolymer transport protein ExbB/TolQ